MSFRGRRGGHGGRGTFRGGRGSRSGYRFQDFGPPEHVVG